MRFRSSERLSQQRFGVMILNIRLSVKVWLLGKGAAMNDHIDVLLSAYERGGCTRRQFIAAVSALLSVPSLGQTQVTPPFVAAVLTT